MRESLPSKSSLGRWLSPGLPVSTPDNGTPGLGTRPTLAGVVIVCLTLVAAGCSTIRERNPVPEPLAETAAIPGIPYARFWGDGLPRDMDTRIERAKERIAKNNPELLHRETSFLALSGGGSNGAFGAGLLAGWTEAGDRPEFTIVTGISAGALIAPFAFVGSAVDAELTEVYTTISTEDILVERSLAAALTSDAMTSTEPLAALIARYIDAPFLERIRLECNRGRSLLIGTTNLDSGRPVIWSICSIAMSEDPKALQLVRDILRASAAIPGAFPPVFFEVEARDGQRYDELHVDGGATSQVFMYPARLDFRKLLEDLSLRGRPRMYVIRNGHLAASWASVTPSLPAITGRSISTLIITQGAGDLYRIYLGAQRDGVDFNLAYIPESFTERPEETFDREYMRQLFDIGYDLAKSGYPWEKAPPGFEPP